MRIFPKSSLQRFLTLFPVFLLPEHFHAGAYPFHVQSSSCRQHLFGNFFRHPNVFAQHFQCIHAYPSFSDFIIQNFPYQYKLSVDILTISLYYERKKEVLFMELNLIPRPKSVTVLEGTCPAAAPITVTADPALSAEAYRLCVTPSGIALACADPQGQIWGEVTLSQLRRQFPDAIPCMEISDAPAFPFRSIHLDVSRHMRTIDELKVMADAASYFKLNKIHWHISDDQGWRIECKAFPKLHEIGSRRKGDHFGTYRSDEEEGGYYTREEVKDFVAYCAARGIEVVPEIDVPGHVMAILAAYPELSCFGDPVEVHTKAAISLDILCAGREEVYTFLETLLEDMLELFPGKWFHIGGDEAPKGHWFECPHCNQKLKELGLENYRQLQGYMMNRLAEVLRRHGRRAIVWNDGAYGGNLDSDIVLEVWFPDKDSAVDTHVAKGGQLIASPVDVCYCDYPYGEHPVAPIHAVKLNSDGTVLGGEALLWSEFVRSAQRMQELCWPRFTALAEATWQGDARSDYADFRSRLEALFPVFAEMGIQATPPSGWDPDEEEAKRQSKEFRLQFEAESENQDYEGLLAQM